MKRIADYRLYIFDWDGTLNSMSAAHRAYETVKRCLKFFKGGHRPKYSNINMTDIKHIVKREELKNRIFASAIDFLVLMIKPKLHNDTIEMLEELRKKGKKIVILSNGSGIRQRKELGMLGITGLFDMIVSAKDMGVIKPDPSGIRMVMRKIKTHAADTVYIGDTADDMLAARLAKVSACAVCCGFHSRARLKSMEPDYIFQSIEELYRNC